MDKEKTGAAGISEAELVAFLATMKVEPAPEADFEGRFLHDLRERLARESVCCPARRLLWDHLVQLFAGFGPRKLAYGASTLGLGILAAGFFAMPDETAPAGVVAVKKPLSRLESSLSSLRPNSATDTAACTTISICPQKKAPYTDSNLASVGFSTSFGSAPAADTVPVNMGLDAHVWDAFPAYTTATGF